MEARTPRVLIVDDQPTVCFVLQEALAKLDSYVVATAANGREALDKFRRDHFDLVVTDLRMPIMDGVELTEAIRATRPDVKIVWITAYGSYKVVEDARRLSVDHCLDKPLQVSTIRQVVQEVLGRQADDIRAASWTHSRSGNGV
jgi:YesN/AraC family two-component response regulator